MRCNDILCQILVDGQPLEEFQVERNGRHFTCWVAAKEGSTYTVEVTNEGREPKPGEDFVARLYLDGNKDQEICSTFLEGKTILKGHWTSPTELQRLAFNRVLWKPSNTDSTSSFHSDDDEYPQPENLSTILVKIRKVKKTVKNENYQNYEMKRSTVIDEEAVRQSGRIGGLDTTTILRPASPVGNPMVFYKTKDVDAASMVTFLFKYGSRGSLEAQGIIARADAMDTETDFKGKRPFKSSAMAKKHGGLFSASPFRPPTDQWVARSAECPSETAPSMVSTSPKKRPRFSFGGMGDGSNKDTDSDEDHDDDYKPKKSRLVKDNSEDAESSDSDDTFEMGEGNDNDGSIDIAESSDSGDTGESNEDGSVDDDSEDNDSSEDDEVVEVIVLDDDEDSGNNDSSDDDNVIVTEDYEGDYSDVSED
ncbi:hypothetical protein HDV00_003680 [Rhizophlyctis rosea]|nr:hypothetical protein HDV00_003680 [Rhizophlyctis rosea]